MTVIPVEQGQKTITLKYTPPHTWLLVIISIIGIILSFVYTKWIYIKNDNIIFKLITKYKRSSSD